MNGNDLSLEAVIEQCLEASERGERVDIDLLSQQYPQYAGELRDFFSDYALGEFLLRSTLRDLSSPEIPQGGFLGDYRIVRLIGQGGTGDVYEGVDPLSGDRVALKTIPSSDANSRLRLRREFRTVATVYHRNLCSHYELHANGPLWFIAMEYVDGTDLLSYWTSICSRPNANELAVRIAAQLMAAVSYLHASGVIHRDIKPANILVTESERLVLLDFGLSTRSRKPSAMSHYIAGTRKYLAPELSRGEPATEASDWYSVGVVVREMLSSVEFDSVSSDLLQIADGLMRESIEDRFDQSDIASFLIGGDQERLLTYRLPQSTFVGRTELLSELNRAFATAAKGRVVVATLSGESGSGKTALVERFLDLTSGTENVLISSGRCFGGELGLGAAIDSVSGDLVDWILSEGFEHTGVGASELRAMKRVFPAFAKLELNVVGDSNENDTNESIDSAELRRIALTSFSKLICDLASKRPLVLFIDDLQWADDESLSMLEHICLNSALHTVLFVFSFRSDSQQAMAFTHRMLIDGAQVQVTQLVVPRMSEVEADSLALSFVPQLVDEGRLRHLTRHCQGSPYLLRELTRSLSRGDRDPVSLSLTELLWRNVTSLADTPASIVKLLACATETVPESVVFDASGSDGADFRQSVQELKASDLVRTGFGRSMMPYHDKIGECIREHLSESETARLHAALARAYERQSPEDTACIAVHHELAGNHVVSAKHYYDAGKSANKKLAFHLACIYFEKALRLGAWNESEEIRIRKKLADSLNDAGRPVEAAQLFLALAEKDRSAELRLRAAQQLIHAGQLEEGHTAARAASQALGMRLSRNRAAAVVSSALSTARIFLRGYKVDCNVLVDESEVRRFYHRMELGGILMQTDNVFGIELFARTFLEAINTRNPVVVSISLCSHAIGLSYLGPMFKRRTETVLETVDAIRSAHSQVDDISHFIDFTKMMVHITRGEWQDAKPHAESGIATLRQHGSKYGGTQYSISAAESFHCWILYYLGQLDELSDLVPNLLLESRERGNRVFQSDLRGPYANIVWLLSDDHERARSEISQARRQWDSNRPTFQDVYWLFADVQVDLYLGDYNSGHRRLAEASEIMSKSGAAKNVFFQTEFAHLFCCSGLGVLAQGDETVLGDILKQLKWLKRGSSAWATALSLLHEAGLHKCREEPKESKIALRRAKDQFSDLGMRLFEVCVGGVLSCADETTNALDSADYSLWMDEMGVTAPSKISRFVTGIFPTPDRRNDSERRIFA